MKAVLTGDIVNSTKLIVAAEEKLLKELRDILSPYKHEFFRGDSFQAYVDDPAPALRIALRCRTAAIGLLPEEADLISDVRISIGIGEVSGVVSDLATAKGEAFLLSGRGLDEMKKESGRLTIHTGNKMGALALEVVADYINSIYKQMTAKQAEVISELLNDLSQQDVAEKLKRSKSTISQHVSAGKWEEIEALLGNYLKIIALLES